MIAAAVHYTLAHHAPLVAAVAERIYPELAPENVSRPYLVYTIIDDVDEQHLLGRSNQVTTRVQIDCWSPSYLQARGMAIEVRDALNAMRGAIPGVGPDGCIVQAVRCDARRNVVTEPSTDAGGGHLHGVSADFIVGWHAADVTSLLFDVDEWCELFAATPSDPQRDPDLVNAGYHTMVGETGVLRALLRFDLASLPAAAYLQQAWLRSTQLVGPVALGTDVHIHAVSQAWHETQASWTHYRMDHEWDTPGGDFAADYAVMPCRTAGDFVEQDVDVTHLLSRGRGVSEISLLLKNSDETAGSGSTAIATSAVERTCQLLVTYAMER